MSNTYLRFTVIGTDRAKTPETVSRRLTIEVPGEQAPISNPNFIHIIPKVSFWLIEFEDDSYYPNREIGLDASETPVVILPWKNNYGYWTDSNVVIKDIMTNFHTEEITKQQFVDKWKFFEGKHG